MKIRARNVLTVVAALGLALPTFAQEGKKAQPTAPGKTTKKPDAQPAQPANPGVDPAMVQMMQLTSPGENHKLLNGMIGTWSAACKLWMDPTGTAPPTESTGTMVNTWQLGGRWVRMEFKGEFEMESNGQKMKMPFGGLGYMGYDNVEQKFNGTWMDTMSTGLIHTKGTYDAAKKVFTMSGDFKDPMSGQTVKEKDVTTIVDDNTMKMEMYHSDAQGKDRKVGEIVYSRESRGQGPVRGKDAPKAPDKK